MHFTVPLSDFNRRVKNDFLLLQADIASAFLVEVTGEGHPVKTGRLRASWRIYRSDQDTDVGGPSDAIPFDYVARKDFGSLFVTNGVWYGPAIDQGIGNRPARNFVDPAVERVARRFGGGR